VKVDRPTPGGHEEQTWLPKFCVLAGAPPVVTPCGEAFLPHAGTTPHMQLAPWVAARQRRPSATDACCEVATVRDVDCGGLAADLLSLAWTGVINSVVDGTQFITGAESPHRC